MATPQPSHPIRRRFFAAAQNDRSPGTVLAIRPGALGDNLLALEALRALRNRFGPSRLHLVGHPGVGLLLQQAGEIDGYTDFDSPAVGGLFAPGSSRALFSAMQPLRAAVAWLSDPNGLVKAQLQTAGIPRVIVAPSRPDPAAGVHMADYLTACLAPWGASAPPWRPVRLPGLASSREQAPGVLVHPGSGSAAKNWAAEGFAQVIQRLERVYPGQVAVLAGPADEAACAAVLAASGRGISVCRPESIRALADLLVDARVYLGNDSGVSHLAASLGVSTVAMFGPTDPALWAPRGGWVRVLPFSSQPEDVSASLCEALQSGNLS